MKNVYFASSFMWDATAEELVDFAAENNIGGIELWAQHVETANINLDKYVSLCNKNNIDTVVHAKSWDLNYASINKSIRKASIDEIKKSVDIACYVNAKEVTVHPPRYSLGKDSYLFEIAKESLFEINEYALSKNIEISMEIMEHIPKEMATTADDMKLLTENLKGISYTVDLAHCITEHEFWHNIDVMKNVSKVHVSNKKDTKLHTQLYDGDFDFGKIYNMLCKMKIPMVIEGFEKGKEFKKLKENISFIKELEEKKNYEEKNFDIFNGCISINSIRM